jgi:hypothetical protein
MKHKNHSMMVLVPTSNNATRLAVQKFPELVGFFISPRTLGPRSSLRETNAKWGGDNDCFNPCGFNWRAFLKMMWQNRDIRRNCLFIVAPDKVGDAKRTLWRFWFWAIIIKLLGFPVALAAQDGLENLSVPWFLLDVLFVGGTTEWKLSQRAVELVKEAKRHKKWVHVGRVNSQRRFQFCYKIGVDSVDGTHFAKEPDYAIGWAVNLLRYLRRQIPLEGL